MPSVIIPAHNEETVIHRTLQGVLADDIDDLEIVVVVNGSSDRTAEIARGLDDRISVIETETPGKTNALNLGEKQLTSFPRVYLDADIELRPGTLSAIIAACGDVHPIVSPSPAHDMSGCSIGMKLYMQAEAYNDYFGRGAPNGSGCFVLSGEARSRWGDFPQVIADDGFVQNQFHPEESATVPGTAAVVLPPRDLRSQLAVRARVRRGGFELRERFPEIMGKHQSQIGVVLRRMAIRPWAWPALAVYSFVRIRERVVARKQLSSGETGWARDDSARSS